MSELFGDAVYETKRYRRDRGAIFGLRGPNAELPIGWGAGWGNRNRNQQIQRCRKTFFTNSHKKEKLKITIL